MERQESLKSGLNKTITRFVKVYYCELIKVKIEVVEARFNALTNTRFYGKI